MNKYTQWIISAGVFLPSLVLAQVMDTTNPTQEPIASKKTVQTKSMKKVAKRSGHKFKHKPTRPMHKEEYVAAAAPAPVYKDVDASPVVVSRRATFPCFYNACTGETPACGGFRVNGYVDVSYNHLSRSHVFTSGFNNRVFDIAENGFTLQQIGLTVAKQPEQGFGGLVNVLIGRDAIATAAYGWNPGTSQVVAVDPLQAYLQYATGKFTFIGGKFVSLTDVEDFDPTQNTNFSRGILFGYAEPGTLLGVRGSYAASDNLGFVLGLNNGWDTIRDFGQQPTLELGTNYNFTPYFSVAASDYFGRARYLDNLSTGPKSDRNLFNIYGTYKATEKLSLIANYVFGFQNRGSLANGTIGRAQWQGIAGYINYAFNDLWRTSLRGELFNDRDGFRTGVAQTWKEVTLTVGYAPIKCVEFRLEARHDFSNTNSFLNKNGIGSSKNQQSYALEGLYKF